MVAITERAAPTAGSMWQNIGAALVGNLLEWYDFAVYGFMAAMIGKAFFPATDPLNSLLLSFAVFGVGFLGRPIGSVVIGWLGDVKGRKPALVITILTMAVSTVLIGLVPGYATIGIAAPIVVVLARLLQGFSTGGEAGNSMAYMVEWAPADRRGLYGGFQQCSSAMGFLLGSGMAAATASLLASDAMESWGWRVPFLIGGIIGPVGAYLRRYSEESPAFRQVVDRPAIKTPAAKAFFLTARGFGFTIMWTPDQDSGQAQRERSAMVEHAGPSRARYLRTADGAPVRPRRPQASLADRLHTVLPADLSGLQRDRVGRFAGDDHAGAVRAGRHARDYLRSVADGNL
jgi:MHS family proline/betaine transporter-like MFS transporter